ncbi:ATP-binding protein [Streptomyces yaizuensis]|uniref:ATP-binding protein n=1 Tax=Streptomyces yaizuensis TaxID=2989713 RepID=A0ABQ5P342_9ACTN|nr:ATP-binding protein [Streptomyces sp. YSPA8]
MGAGLRRQDQTRRLALSGIEGTVARSRDFTARALADWGWAAAGPERTGDALLLVSELVTNACLHAGGPTELVLRYTPELLRIEVADGSPRPPAPRPRAIALPGGHGLVVLERLALRWGSEPRDGGGKAVWAELTPPDAPRVR